MINIEKIFDRIYYGLQCNINMITLDFVRSCAKCWYYDKKIK